MINKKGFTLVELLAVIVILAVILIIAVPKITDVIKNTKKASMEEATKLIVSQAEKQWMINQTISTDDSSYVDLNANDACNKISKFNDIDYQSCSIKVDDKGAASITLIGKNKFDNIICNGTNDNINCSEGEVKYTIRRRINSTSTIWERVDDNVGKVANATKDGSSVRNDFDSIYPWSDIITYNYDVSTAKETYYGNPNFKFDGTNGEVLTRIPKFYYRRYQEEGYEYISISPYELENYETSEEFSVGRYIASYDTGMHSISNQPPAVKHNITWFRTEAKKVGANFGLMDYHLFLIQMLYLVEYADYNSQNALGDGIATVYIADTEKALVAESSTNRIIVNAEGANKLKIGQLVHIGSANIAQNNIGSYKKITKIEDYNEDGIVGKAVYFDGNPVNIAVDNVIYGSPQVSGGCDSLGMKSGTILNDGYHNVSYRGIEDLYGQVWQFLDGINVKDRVPYVNMNPSTYKINTFADGYEKINYTMSQTNGTIKTLGFDSTNQLVGLPIEIGGEQFDTYQQAAGNQIFVTGGGWFWGTGCGLWAMINRSGTISGTNYGARLIKY